MSTRTVAVASTSGLHARPASLFTQAVTESGIDVTIAHGGNSPVDASSILLVMSLGVPHGDEVTLEADGDEADRVLDELAALLGRNLDEAS
ncbi:HPr family phosphocarrier protein [Sanguibacter antarcticus]|uniref:Phosphocarrier protein HPr n=1 Tax=Sanguibacter antarcticus TaxID=372484 RepID=A0A2A9E6U0_9MICO|nr:HPr family phosphocarrier protein [Sanguibacter antarcticus]PFG33952.1 phosphocarrier protein HPr [Sanguibacter antarcticus]